MANLLVVGGNLPRGAASFSAQQRGLRAFFAEHSREAGVLLAGLPFAACVVMPRTPSLDVWGVGAFVRRRAPGIPVALVVGPSRIDDSARVVWTAVELLGDDTRAAIADIASQACLDWTTRTWDEDVPTADVYGLAGRDG
jgi:hypothetical protein